MPATIVDAQSNGVFSVDRGERIGILPVGIIRSAIRVDGTAAAAELASSKANIRPCLLESGEGRKDTRQAQRADHRSGRRSRTLRGLGAQFAKAEIVYVLAPMLMV